MHSASSLLYGGLPDRDPLDRDPLPWTDSLPWTQTPSPGQRLPPLDRDPLPLDRDPIYRDPLDRATWAETPWTEITLDRDSPPSLDRDPPVDRQTPVKTLPSQTSFVGGNNNINVKGWLNWLNFKGNTSRLKEMLIFTILPNFVCFPCISDRNLIILFKFTWKLPCA